MKLSKAANYFDKESFSIYDSSTKVWTADQLQCRILPVDRFLSNFSRPLHRRMLICDSDTILPSSNTIRSDATNEVYIIGQGRYDAYSNSPYQALYMAHLVSGASGAVGTLTRKLPSGPSTDPGHLVQTTVGEYYMDIELRATTPEKGAEHKTAGQYYMMSTPECDFTEWDYASLKGVNYRIEEGYFDSGLKFARVLQIEDDRVNLTYIRTTSFAYDQSTGKSAEVTQNYNVTGSVHDYKKVAADTKNVSEDTFKVIIPSINIGFNPQPREKVIVSSTTHAILQVARDPLTTEWVLICQA